MNEYRFDRCDKYGNILYAAGLKIFANCLSTARRKAWKTQSRMINDGDPNCPDMTRMLKLRKECDCDCLQIKKEREYCQGRTHNVSARCCERFESGGIS